MSAERKRGLDIVNRKFLLDYPAEAGRAIDALSRTDATRFMAGQAADVIVAVWRHLSLSRADEILSELPEDLAHQILLELDPGICAAALRRASGDQRAAYLKLMSPAAAEEIKRLISYAPDTVGRIMESRIVTFPPDETASAALQRLRDIKPKGLRQLFLVDDDQRLTATVDIQDLAMADPDELLGTISRPPRATTSPFDSHEFVAEQLKDLSLEVLPVVDVNGRMIGVIRHAALLKTLREETSADMQTMVGVSKDERALSSPWFAVKKRLPWMEINLATAFLAASVVGFFESTIARFTALAVLLPVVAGQSGNAGAQALAVTMRGLSLREITGRHWFQVMFKEGSVGILNGIAIALTTALGVFIWSRSFGLALVISVAMILSMFAAGIAGALIPITLTRIGQDPAQSSSIILTTVTDVAGFMSFLGIATLLAELL